MAGQISVEEAMVEVVVLEWFAELGYRIGRALTPDAEHSDAERRGSPKTNIPAQT
jgi:hypothetical protein